MMEELIQALVKAKTPKAVKELLDNYEPEAVLPVWQVCVTPHKCTTEEVLFETTDIEELNKEMKKAYQSGLYITVLRRVKA